MIDENVSEPDEPGTAMHELLEKYLGFPPMKSVQVSLPRQHSKNLLVKALEAGVPTEPTEFPEGMKALGFTDMPSLPELRRKVQEAADAEALRQIRNLTHERMAADRMDAFPERIQMTVRGFPKTEDAAHQHFQDAMAKFAREVLPPFRDSIQGLFQTVETTWRSMTPAMEMIAKIEREMDGKPVHPKDIRDERGVKQPSPVPPFWAARPNGRRR
ncbi:hypothetical protein GoPhGRU1p89 [Gordonia phage GRU1]|uniref:Uncharacterized protein n=1 Tax=Gordonia phage GRU1 TaxID=1109710 RepID=G8EK48_9CAUD|nr:hypothetical protein GoPhGRU1p89 [Gordonia phage GRU1]AET09930.1 hypothetical protein [Gordonia phage GRU1]